MQISTFCSWRMPNARLKKLLLVMKLTTLLIFIGLLQVSAATLAQHITLSEKNVSLEKLFSQLEAQSGYTFLYKAGTLNNLPNVNVDINDATITEVLDKCFANKPLEYLVIDKSIVIKRKPVPQNTPSAVAPFNKLIQGVVNDEAGRPLPGVSIRLKDSNLGWTTDQNGEFKALILKPDAILQFSFIGYTTKEIAIKDINGPITVSLQPAVGSLDEVQVLAYGTTTKRLNTGNVVTITAREIEKNPVPNVLQALENRVPGMFIQQNTGVIGGSFNTQIRNGSSLAGTAPLFIVDGVQYPANRTLPYLSGLGNANSSTSQAPNLGGNALNFLNPEDIESVSVLKDADATALYGSRGAYGVVLITTKKGKAGPATLSVNGFDGVTTRGIMPELMNTDQYLTIRREAFKNDGATPGATDLDLNGTWPTDRYTDFRKYYLGSVGQDQNLNMSYSGGSNNTNYLVSGNVRNQRSIQKGKGGEVDGGGRFDMNTTSQNKKFFFDISATYNLTRNNTIPFDFIQAIAAAPNSPTPILPDGTLDWSTGTNPAAAINADYLNTTNNFIANTTLRYNVTNDLILNAQIGFNTLTTKEFRALPTSYFVPSPTSYTRTTSTINTYTFRNFTIDPNIQYNKTFLKKAHLDSRVGITLQDGSAYQTTIAGTSFSSDALLASPTNASGSVVSFYNSIPRRYSGAFALLHLNWDGKYLLSLNGRRDGSTNFGPGHRFGNFGSVAGAWIMSDEPWMKPISNVLNFAKLRASFGTTGGDQVGDYQYLNTFSISPSQYAGSIGLIPTRIANPNLHWESKKSEEVGGTFQFFKGRLELDASYYRSWTTDALYATALSNVTGFSNFIDNTPGAKLLTYGYEATLSTQNIKTKNFRWTTNLNFTAPRSKLLAFPGLDNLNSVNLTNVNYVLDKPITGIRLYNYAGVNPQTGNYQYISATGVKADYALFGTGSLNNVTDRTEYVDLAPKYYGGIGNSFSYKNLSLDFFITLTRRNAKNLLAQQLYTLGAFNQNLIVQELDRWQKPGDITNVPKATQSVLGLFSQSAFSSSTGGYSNTTYARLSNVNINYDFSGSWLKKAHLKRLSLFLRGQNLLTISKYKDLDPESLSINSTGPLRVFVGGFNITL